MPYDSSTQEQIDAIKEVAEAIQFATKQAATWHRSLFEDGITVHAHVDLSLIESYLEKLVQHDRFLFVPDASLGLLRIERATSRVWRMVTTNFQARVVREGEEPGAFHHYGEWQEIFMTEEGDGHADDE